MADLLIKNVGYLITVDGERRIIKNGALAVTGTRIEAVGPTKELEERYLDAAQTIDARGGVVTPGFVDAHQHLTVHFLRGLGDEVRLPVLLHDRLYPLEAAQTEEEAYLACMCALLESIRAGTTCVCDPGSQTPEPAVRAVEESGVRAVLMRSLTDVSGGRNMPGTFSSATQDALTVGEDFVKQHLGAAGGRIRPWFSLRTERMVSDELCRQVADLARQYDVGLCSHMISNKDSVEQHMKVFDGRRPIERYEADGVLGPNVLLVHCTYLEDDECDVLAERDVKVVICPTAAVTVAYGAMERGTHLKLHARGVTVSAGSDTSACSHTLDMLRVAQYFRVYRDIKEDATIMPPETILEALTVDGARSLLWEDEIGSLEPGKKADLLIFDTDRPEWVPLHNPLSNLIHTASGDSVDTVVIDGRVIVRRGEFVDLDSRRILQRGREAAADIAQRTGLDTYGRPRWPMV